MKFACFSARVLLELFLRGTTDADVEKANVYKGFFLPFGTLRGSLCDCILHITSRGFCVPAAYILGLRVLYFASLTIHQLNCVKS